MKTPEIIQILNNQQINGGPFWSREDGDIHAPHGQSTIDTLTVLGELGATINTYSDLSKAIDFVLRYQTPDGAFKYSRRSSKLPCMTARILAVLGRLGYVNQQVEKSYHQLLQTQWSDGGWRCNTVKIGKSRETDASNPGTTLYLLDAFRFRNNGRKNLKQLEKGVDFLLRHWTTRLPLGPCDFGMGTRFFKIEYPFLRYNLFYYLYVLSFYGKACKDQRFVKAVQMLSSKLENGKVVPENPHKAWRKFEFATKGQISTLATKRWEEIEEHLKMDA